MEKLFDGSIASKILWAAKESGINPKIIKKKTGYERRYVERVLSKYVKG